MMSLCINFRLFSLVILLRNQIILGANVTVTEDDTVCVGNNITVTCKIDPFTTPPSATWNRNGAALTTCTSGGICTTDSLVLNGIKYSFFGGPNDIQVSLQVQQVENGIQWNCDYDGKTYPYTFTVLNECEVTTEGSTEGGSSGSPDNTKSIIGMAVGISVAAIVVIAIIAVILYRIHVKKGPFLAPQQPLVIKFTSSDFVQISWKRPQNVNEFLIKYHIDAADMSSNVWSSLVKDIVDTTYNVKISNLHGSGVRFRVKSECNNVVSKPLLSNEYLLLEDKYKPSAPLKVQRRDNMCVLSWASPIKRDHGQIKYRIDVQWMGLMGWKTIKEDVTEVTGSVDISDLQGKGVLFRVIAKHDNGVSKPLIAEENLNLEPRHFE